MRGLTSIKCSSDASTNSTVPRSCTGSSVRRRLGLPQAIVQVQRRDLGDLLMPPLRRAVALTEVDDVIAVAPVWTSTCHGSACSRKQLPSPNAASASAAVLSTYDSTSSKVRAMRMPMPPPPINALIWREAELPASAALPRRCQGIVRAGHDGHVRRDGHLPRRDLVREGE